MKPNSATEQNITLNLLTEWEGNPRKTRGEAAIEQMSASIDQLGQQAPLIVFQPEGEAGFQVVEGETRRRALNALADRGSIEADAEIRCWVLPADTDEATLKAIAVAANTVREQMNPIEEMEAFLDLAKSGLSLQAIADMFNYGMQTVKQRLALGELVEGARDLVRTGKRTIGWAQAMTVGSPEGQERVVNAILANEGAFPDSASVKAELTRGQIPVSSALFDPQELSDCLACDLFSQDGDHFTDVNKFWERQGQEIQKKIDDLNETHADVKFIDRTRFDDAGWTTGGEEAESTAVIIAYDDGSVEVRTGLIPPAIEEDDGEGDFLADAEDHYGSALELDGNDLDAAEATATAANDGSDADASAAPADAPAKAKVNPLDNATKDTASLLTAQVSAALKIAVASDHRLSMAFVVASTLTRRGPASSMQIAGLPIDTRNHGSQVFTQLQTKRAARDRIVTEAGVAGMTSPAGVIAKLMELEDGLLEQLFAYTVADSIAAGVDEDTMDIFDAVGVDVLAGWQIDEAYLATLNNAQIRVLATEVVETSNQPSPRAARGLVEKAIMEAVDGDALAGNFMSDDASWSPPQVLKAIQNAAARRDQAAAKQEPIAQAA
ncbi:ParB/RepB/Spo0J family partition protein [Erythrobacter aureus]|uniref:ParB/RepB/Spo0J family partition protein n=1 Tax=Erythrobacter aureus TaxID=2182384 RepID=UPI0013B38C60|nr:ParB N-terminal domain-containing protein [Erythrobacter aureus]